LVFDVMDADFAVLDHLDAIAGAIGFDRQHAAAAVAHLGAPRGFGGAVAPRRVVLVVLFAALVAAVFAMPLLAAFIPAILVALDPALLAILADAEVGQARGGGGGPETRPADATTQRISSQRMELV
jgi:hypothetical protein